MRCTSDRAWNSWGCEVLRFPEAEAERRKAYIIADGLQCELKVTWLGKLLALQAIGAIACSEQTPGRLLKAL